MVKVIGVSFRNGGKVYYFSTENLPVKRGLHVIVETARGVEFGTEHSNRMSFPLQNSSLCKYILYPHFIIVFIYN